MIFDLFWKISTWVDFKPFLYNLFKIDEKKYCKNLIINFLQKKLSQINWWFIPWLFFLPSPWVEQIHWKNDFMIKGFFFPLFSFSVYYALLRIKPKKGPWSQNYNWVKLDIEASIVFVFNCLELFIFTSLQKSTYLSFLILHPSHKSPSNFNPEIIHYHQGLGWKYILSNSLFTIHHFNSCKTHSLWKKPIRSWRCCARRCLPASACKLKMEPSRGQ